MVIIQYFLLDACADATSARLTAGVGPARRQIVGEKLPNFLLKIGSNHNFII